MWFLHFFITVVQLSLVLLLLAIYLIFFQSKIYQKKIILSYKLLKYVILLTFESIVFIKCHQLQLTKYFAKIYQKIMQNLNGADHQNRKKVNVDKEQAIAYRNTLRNFQTLYQEGKDKFQTSDQTNYYLLSTQFLKQWKDFCEKDSQQRLLPIAFNSDIIDANTGSLKLGLVQNADFEIITADTMKLFKGFEGKCIYRKAKVVDGQKKVKIHLTKFKYIVISREDTKSIEHKKYTAKQFEQNVKFIEQSEDATISEFCEIISRRLELNTKIQIRLWKVDMSIKDLYKDIYDKVDRLPWHQFKIKGPGKRLEELETKLSDLNLLQNDYFVVEHKQHSGQWYFQSETEGKCEGCYKMYQLKYPCACKKVAYCTQHCRQKDKRYHMGRCSVAAQMELNQKVEMIMTSNSSRGLTGLNNLGNTCFMNSCLQCLSHTMPLTQYFLKSYYQTEINKENPLGTKGKLAKNYAKFIKGMWCDSSGTFSPYNLKSAVASINPVFQGYAQQDSQQFFSFIVDGLHEDLNRVLKKPIVESIQSKGREDKIVALESWIAHTKRNQSIIIDTMTGQYKSKVTCPDCNKTSITFDPFITLTVPIPQENTISIEFYLIYANFQQETKKMSITYKKPNLEQWKQKVSKDTGLQKKCIQFYILTMTEGIYRAGVLPISEIVHKVESESKNLFLIERTEQQINFQNPIEFTARCSKKSYYHDNYQSIWFKFPLIFDKKGLNGQKIYKRILKFLYYQGYDYSTNRKSTQSKTYLQYEKQMLKDKPFELVVRYGKKKEKSYYRTQYKFQSQRPLKDEDILDDILKQINIDDMQIDARFDKKGIQHFSFDNMKNFKDCTDRGFRGKYDSEDITVTLEQCLQNLREPQQLQQGNQWYCSECKQHKRATKQLSIYKAPKILIVHLKRFKQKGQYKKQKNQSKVIFPTRMNFQPYICDPTPMETYYQQMKKEGIYIQPSFERSIPSSKPIYELYAVSNHYGGLGGGHYTAYGKNNGRWYDFNDSSVRSSSEHSISGSGAYLLFYQRVN